MTGKLSEKQKTWMRGLRAAGRWVPMSASEMGDPQVRALKSRGIVRIVDGREYVGWQLTDAGEAALDRLLGRIGRGR